MLLMRLRDCGGNIVRFVSFYPRPSCLSDGSTEMTGEEGTAVGSAPWSLTSSLFHLAQTTSSESSCPDLHP